jgi:uncharacterized glyoxalase superfamily protein PhnB
MAANRIVPYLLYEDVAAAIDWLGKAFGFTEELRFTDPDGSVTHAELQFDDNIIYLGDPGGDYVDPRRKGYRHCMISVVVDDVDAHHARAAAAGATIIEPPVDKDYGWRSYRVEDPAGHQWEFGREIAKLAPSERSGAA